MDKLLNTSSQESRNICGVHSVQKFFSLLLTAFNFYCNLHMLERLRGEGGREFCLFLFCFVFCCISLPFSCFTLKKTGSSVKVHGASLAVPCTHVAVYFRWVSFNGWERGADGVWWEAVMRGANAGGALLPLPSGIHIWANHPKCLLQSWEKRHF